MIRAFSDNSAGGRSSGIWSGPGTPHSSGPAGRVRGRRSVGGRGGPGHAEQLRVRRASLVAIHRVSFGLERELWGLKRQHGELQRQQKKRKRLGLANDRGESPAYAHSRLRAPNMLWGAHDNAPTSWG